MINKLESIITANLTDLERKYRQAQNDAVRTARGMDAAFKNSPNIKPDFSRVKSGFRDLEGQATSTAGRIKGAFSGVFGGVISTAAGNLLSGALTKVAGAMTDGIKTGIDYNKTLERSQVAFEIMTGSADRAQSHLKDLEKLAMRTPFQFEDLIGASLRMQAFGFSAEQVTRDLPKLSDAASIAAAGSGNFKEALDGIIIALGQMKAKGKLSFEEMNQLTERGIPAWDILAQKVGKTKEQVMRLTERGQLKGDVANELLTRGLGEFAGGIGERLSKTVSGKESNVEDLYRKRAAEDTQKLFEAYRQGLDETMRGLEQGTGQSVTAKTGEVLAKNLDFGTQILQAINAGKIGELVKDAIKGTLESIKPGLSQSGAELWQSIQDGFISAIQTRGASAWEAVKTWGGGVVKSAKDILGIKSPSTVFAEIGADVARGFDLGLEAGKQKPKSLIDPEAAKAKLLEELRKLRDDPQIKAMLDTIASAEGAGYNTLFGGETFSDYSQHPNQRIRKKLGGRNITSTAAGRYQFLSSTWQGIANQTGLSDFSPQSQDLGAILLMKQRGMLGPLMQGDISTALTKGNREWASLPGSPYGQPTKSATDLIDKFQAALEKLTDTTIKAADAFGKIVQVGPLPAFTMAGGGNWQPNPLKNLSSSADKVIPTVAALSPELSKLSDETTLAKAALSATTPALDKTASALDKVTAEGEDAWRRLRGGKTFEQLRKQEIEDAKDMLEPEAVFKRFQDFRQKLGSNIDGALQDLIQGTDTLGSTARKLLVGTVNDIFQSMIQEILLKATGGAASSIGGLIGNSLGSLLGGIFRAEGGPVTAGMPYIVGEQGPEPFIPSTDGYVLSRQDAMRAVSGGGGQASGTTVINFNITTPTGNVPQATQSQMADKLLATLGRNMRRG